MLQLYIFTYIFLAHMLADFVFQPDSLVAWKHRSWKGIFTHSFILFVTMLVFFWPFVADINLWAAGTILLVAVLHFFIDRGKIRREQRSHHYVRLFLADQLFHIIVATLATFGLNFFLKFDLFATGQLLSFFGGFFPFAIYLIIAVLSTYAYEILLYQFARESGEHHAVKFNYQRMFLRLMVLSLIFMLAMFLSGFHIAKTLF